MPTVVIQGPDLNLESAEEIAHLLKGHLEHLNQFARIQVPILDTQALIAVRTAFKLDINALPPSFQPHTVKLVISDMDSTFINIECIDEIADTAGIKPQIAAITEAAMRGELDFPQALRRRVSLLAGLPTSALEHVYNERLQLNPGGNVLLESLKIRGIPFALVSGGFTFFTERLKQRYGLEYTLANVLDVRDGKLTGQVLGDIVGADQKANLLRQLCNQLNINLNQTVALGDGANDLLMLRLAGLSIGYHAKPQVREQTHVQLNFCGLEGVLGLLDIDSS